MLYSKEQKVGGRHSFTPLNAKSPIPLR